MPAPARSSWPATGRRCAGMSIRWTTWPRPARSGSARQPVMHWRDSRWIVQGTVRNFDPETGAGDVLLDDGRAVPFDGAAFAAGGLRLLRLGQRVRLEHEGDRIVRITLITMP